jgi:hypothetical protein
MISEPMLTRLETKGQYDPTLSGWDGFSFLIGIIPAAYV